MTSVQLLYFDDCPHWRLAEERLRVAFRNLGRVDAFEHILVITDEDARRLGFRGSPTVLVDGRDPFGRDGDPVGLSCRLYGAEYAPTVEQIQEALQRVAP